MRKINTPPKCIIAGQVYKSQQNGMVYDPRGISPCITVGHHAGVEPRIIEYETNEEYSKQAAESPM